jgi:hypothetical protein
MQNCHASSDTHDTVDLHQLVLNTTIVAAVTYGIADRARPIPRLSRDEISKVLEPSGLEKAMKAAGMPPASGDELRLGSSPSPQHLTVTRR